MSSTVLTVSYLHHRVKVPYKPATVLKDIRDQACKALSLESAEFGLKHSRKPLDLTLPFRYSNLVDNAHIDLVKLSVITGPVRVKVRVPGKSDFVGTFDAADDLSKVAASAGVDQLMLGGQPVSGSLGAVATGSVMFVGQKIQAHPAKVAPKPAQVGSVPPQKASKEAQLPPNPELAGNKPATSSLDVSNNSESQSVPPLGPGRQLEVILPAQPGPLPADDEAELTQSQFRAYHKYLQDQAGSRPMLSKSTREKLAQERRKDISHITVRVRLPDQTHLQAVFASTESTDVLYDFVRSHLRNPLQEFYLTAVDSPGKIELGKSLIFDYKFAPRVLLLFKWVHNPELKVPVLNDATLELVKQPVSAQQDSLSNSQVDSKANTKPATATPKSEKGHKNVPKWLKLHK